MYFGGPELIYRKSLGRKVLDVYGTWIGLNKYLVSTHLSSDIHSPRIEGETTQLYTDLFNFCKEIADYLNMDIVVVIFNFSTFNLFLKEWARSDKIRQVWNWDSITESGNEFVAVKEIISHRRKY